MKTSVAPDRRKNAHSRFERIYTKVRDRICLLQYEPGTVLSENELAEEFNVSRTPIRRVLQRLEYEGLVNSRHGVGTIVTSVDVRSLKEVYALRIRLAELIGELCAPPTVSKADLRLLESLVEKCRTLRGRRNPIELGKVNLTLSQIIIRYISNRPLQEVFERLFYQTARVWQQILTEMDWAHEVDVMIEEITQTTRALMRRSISYSPSRTEPSESGLEV